MVELARRLFTVDEYYRMAEAGILNENDRVELIEGEIVEMVPIGSRHASVVDDLNALFSSLTTREQAIVRVQGPIRLDNMSEPQPDIAVLRPRPDRYREGHPTPDDVLLLIEVADSSVSSDRSVKLPLYAQSGIAEVWIVDLSTGRIEVYSRPENGTYADVSTAGHGDAVSPRLLPSVSLAVEKVLG